jgi:hypothetical protein
VIPCSGENKLIRLNRWFSIATLVNVPVESVAALFVTRAMLRLRKAVSRKRKESIPDLTVGGILLKNDHIKL